MSELEIWKPLTGPDAPYEISNYGRIKSLDFKHTGEEGFLKAQVGGDGYWTVSLYFQGKRKHSKIHLLVLEHFVGPKPRPELDGCHNDGNKNNNFWLNLRWDTRAGNFTDKIKHGTSERGEGNPQAKLTEEIVKYILKNPDNLTQQQIAEKLGISYTNVNNIVLRKRWAHVTL